MKPAPPLDATDGKKLAARARATWEEVQHSIASKGYVDEGHRAAFDSIISQIAALESAKPDESLKALEAAVEAKRDELIELVKSDQKLEQEMSKIKRTPYEIGYSEAAGKGRVFEFHLVEWFLKLITQAQGEPKEMRA